MYKSISCTNQILGLLRHLALGKQPRNQETCSFQSLQSQGSPSGVQTLDLMKANQICYVSDKKRWGSYISVFQRNCISWHKRSKKIAKSSSFFFFFCFPSTFALLEFSVLLYCSFPVFPSSCAFKIYLKHFLYLPNQIYFCNAILLSPNVRQQSRSWQAISYFCCTDRKHWSMPQTHLILDSAARTVTIFI